MYQPHPLLLISILSLYGVICSGDQGFTISSPNSQDTGIHALQDSPQLNEEQEQAQRVKPRMLEPGARRDQMRLVNYIRNCDKVKKQGDIRANSTNKHKRD